MILTKQMFEAHSKTGRVYEFFAKEAMRFEKFKLFLSENFKELDTAKLEELAGCASCWMNFSEKYTARSVMTVNDFLFAMSEAGDFDEVLKRLQAEALVKRLEAEKMKGQFDNKTDAVNFIMHADPFEDFVIFKTKKKEK